ncbi:MAG: pentapeptide repeat-containing protein [Dehalococcoidia bacterium]|nr:pentapeptide repeat-containing protein [Dehalococcoidia bacterium]
MTNNETLAMLERDVTQFNKFRHDNPAAVPDLSGVDLSGANLAQADLNRANLAGANLGNANLEKADLRGADLTSATLHRARLQGVDLQDAKVGGFESEGRICIHSSSFQGVRWDKAQLEEMLRIMNLNERWLIKYEIAPK